ncbi:TonB family protein [Fimbriimonas ginsengisoli]|uniref:TonB family protein n=1 Tax=Fimbriimonas ginsengisoli Gsoil 348 TaxID=661478 RepID=A0A068NSE3_FIMGI|nr:TonB family protein [Fimbriimonas ginsengisoli]AIE86463.1 TonB family protein [Fimbriimonas ginsengisoli Gsoil 348]
MARRRRRKNPLLTRILVVSLVAHAIALPILAHYGAFEKIRQQFGTSRVVMVTVPPIEEPKKAAKKEEKKPAKTAKNAGKKAPGATRKTPGAAKSNVPQPKVVAAGNAGGGDQGPAVDANGTGKAGQLPVEPKPKPPGNETVTPPVKPPETPKPQPPVEPKPEPPKEPVKQPVTEPKPEPPKAKRLIQAEPTYAPEPTIPDELRTEPFEKTLIVEADVDIDGKPANVHIATGTGIKQLDDIGLDTAKKYKFRPATLDASPVPQHVRFRIIFKVD